VVRYGDVVAVDQVDLRLDRGEVVALMGRNGSGKSTLLWALRGVRRPVAGRLRVLGHDMLRLDKAAARRLVGLVPQTASDLLYLETVADECAQADAESAAAPGTCRALLDELTERAERPDDLVDPGRHPRDLSEGQRLALVLAIQLTAAPGVVLLDEPTRGLDYRAKEALARVIDRLTAWGHVVVVATHDVEFAARVADRVVVMADGQIVADGQADEVLVASPSLAPQVAKVLGPRPWLTVGQVADALAGAHV
jgi:energy-coupling factor transport system ATP-binding protein